jgi:predicted nucleic-acid-binding Zn-ribbon protein
LGVNTNDEYGWICECSSVGVAPGKREAVIQLLSRIELLWKLFDYPNTQTRMYAADALIYKDYLTKKMIDKEKKKDSEYSNGIIENLKSKLMTKAEWQKIFNLRDSNLTVKTCGNTGSSKIYDSTTSGLLSDKAIDEIPGQYKLLEDLGYLRGYIYNE